MSFARLLAKNVHLSIDEEFCAIPCQKICMSVSPLLNGDEFTLSVAKNVALFETVRILRTVKWRDWEGIEAAKQTMEFPAAPFFLVEISKKWIKLIPKTIGNRKKRDWTLIDHILIPVNLWTFSCIKHRHDTFRSRGTKMLSIKLWWPSNCTGFHSHHVRCLCIQWLVFFFCERMKFHRHAFVPFFSRCLCKLTKTNQTQRVLMSYETSHASACVAIKIISVKSDGFLFLFFLKEFEASNKWLVLAFTPWDNCSCVYWWQVLNKGTKKIGLEKQRPAPSEIHFELCRAL